MSNPQTKVALITGAAQRRVGWHVAEALAERGYALVLPSRNPNAAAVEHFAARGIVASVPKVDLTDDAAVKSLVQDTLARFGQIDVLVTCAGAWNRKKLEETTASDVREHFEANTVATFLCVQQVGLAMVKQPSGGCIVTVGDWAVTRPYLDYASYFPSKGAIPTMTRSLAVELGTRNPAIRVNCILPGPVMLPPDLSAAEREQSISGTLVKREGSPKHIAQAALFFLDNDFVNGVCLPVDGGRSIYAADSHSTGD